MTPRAYDVRTPTAFPPDISAPPRQLGRFRVVRRIAAGGMGTVYAGVDTENGQQVALKVLNGQRAHDDVFVERLRREAEAISVIDSPYVVRILGFGTAACGRYYLAMEMIRGSTLAAVLDHCGTLPPARAAKVALGIARGLAASHARHLVHRDLKPSNVMIGYGDRVKIVDFGIVSVAHASYARIPSASRLTQEGTVLGTPTYMAPEQILCPEVGAAADLYALGILLFEILTGQPPFEGDIRQVAVFQLMQTPPRVPACGGLETLVERLLEKDPARRPADADEVVRILEAMVARYDRTPAPRRPSPARRAPKRRVSTALAMAAMGLALGGVVDQLGPYLRDVLSARPASASTPVVPARSALTASHALPHDVTPAVAAEAQAALGRAVAQRIGGPMVVVDARSRPAAGVAHLRTRLLTLAAGARLDAVLIDASGAVMGHAEVELALPPDDARWGPQLNAVAVTLFPVLGTPPRASVFASTAESNSTAMPVSASVRLPAARPANAPTTRM